VWVIRYTKDNLLKTARSFKVNLRATEGANTQNLYVKSTWESANTDMVTLESETVENNSNVVQVLAGVTGETAVTVTVDNGKTGKNKVTLYEESFIIRVIDATPRLVQSTLTVDSNSTAGTPFDLLSVYGYEVDPATVKVVESVKNGKVTDYEVTTEANYVTVRYMSDQDGQNGQYYLDVTPEGKRFIDGRSNKAYSKMYFEGEYEYSTESGGKVKETFRVPIKSLVLTCKMLKPTIKYSGKINLFFNNKAAASDSGKVTLTQSLKNLKVTKYELISEEHYANPDAYEKEGSTLVDALANNFDISCSGVIIRSGNELIKDAKGKAVVKGYVRITYEGYEKPSCVKVTIPTKTTKPSYVLSKTKATVNRNANGYRIELQLLNKKTKKPLELDQLNKLSFDESSSGTTYGLFKDFVEADTENAKLSDKITLQLETPQKGKAVINVQMNTWNEPMKFTFNLSVTDKNPTVKAKPTTLTLNNLCAGREAQTVLTLNQADSTLTDMGQPEYVGRESLETDASMISFSYANGVLTASAGVGVQAGSYKFRFTPTVTYANGTSIAIKPITITAKVVATKLTATLKPSSATLNNRYLGKETGVYKYTIKNLPAGDGVKVSGAMVVEGVNQKAENAKSSFDFAVNDIESSITVTQTGTAPKGSYKYRISGLEVDGAEIKPFNITVKVIDTPVKLTTKAKGTLSIGNANSSITYTLKLSNYNTKIQAITFTELNTSDNLNESYGSDNLHNFTATPTTADDGSITGFVVKARAGVVLDAKTTYKFKVNMVETDATLGKKIIVQSSEIKIKPKQTVPKVKTDVTSATLYAGVKASDPKRSQEIQVTTTDDTAKIVDVELADGNSEYLKKAFKVGAFDPETQKVKITLVRPDMLKPDTVYSLKLEARFEGQMSNTKGRQFTINVKVIR
ncbi:MAG: hypothetical protein NC092_04225, partial [Butyrivibrio sp.]|nr:hypothetical protein [Butyrivibrio sp.]